MLAAVVESSKNAGFKPIVAKPVVEEDVPLPDEAPVVVGAVIEDERKPDIKPKKPKGGLQMAADVARDAAALKAAQAASRERERKQLEDARRAQGLGIDEDDTIIRGADGRPIDTKAAKAEEARRKRAEVEKEMQRMEWGKGLVQREDKEKRREAEAAIAAKPMARCALCWILRRPSLTPRRFADDVDLNAQQREVDRWNDPAAAFLTVRDTVSSDESLLTLHAEEGSARQTQGTHSPAIQGSAAAAESLRHSAWLSMGRRRSIERCAAVLPLRVHS
jgi:pre-mRNA-splicing factor CWC26